MVLCLMSKSVIHFQATFVYGVRPWSSLILLHVAVVFLTPLIEKTVSFLHCILLAPLSQINWPTMHELSIALYVCFYARTIHCLLL